MVWLDMTQENGSGIYLDIRGIEARRGQGATFFAIAGVVGDGMVEAEVLVEVGAGVEVTFVDEWLNAGNWRELFARAGREKLVTALVDSVSAMSFCIESFPAPAGKPRQRVSGYRADSQQWLPVRPCAYTRQMELPLTVAVPAVDWETSRVAAQH